MSGEVFAYGRHWSSASAVVEAERCFAECRCVYCGQHIDGRLMKAYTDALLRVFELEAILLLERKP